MAGAEAAGDQGFELKSQRLWCIFLIAVLFGMTLYQTVLGGVVGTYMGGSLRGTMYFLGVGVAAMVFLALGLCGAYGFYRRILGFYGLLSLLLSALFLVGFVLVLVGVNTNGGRGRFSSSCAAYAMGDADDTWDAEHCDKYFEAIKPAAEGVCAMGLVIALALAASSYLAFKLRWFSASVPDRTQRYEAVAPGGGPGAGGQIEL